MHDTASGTPKGSSQKAHTKDRGAAYVLPLGIQKVVPEVLGRAMSDKIHDTGGGDADMGKK